MSEAKKREVIPDLTNRVGKCLEMTRQLRAHHSALHIAVYGEAPGKGDEEKPLDGGSIQVLEGRVNQLADELLDVNNAFLDIIATILGGAS